MHYAGKWEIRRYRFSHIHSQSPVCCLTACTPISLSPLPPLPDGKWGFGGAWRGSLARLLKYGFPRIVIPSRVLDLSCTAVCITLALLRKQRLSDAFLCFLARRLSVCQEDFSTSLEMTIHRKQHSPISDGKRVIRVKCLPLIPSHY